MSVELEDFEVDYTGCNGFKGGHDDLSMFLDDFIMMTHLDEVHNPQERWVACIWGQPGIGKTSKVKDLKNTPVTWNGEDYPGWKVVDVPAAQFEEMGDIHGLPDKCVFVTKDNEKGRWVSVETDVIEGWKADGWAVDFTKGTRTMYSPPPFVPIEPGPTIILIDDANRTSQRILKGMMQLFQTYGTVSWKLPPGCAIILTGNPGMQDFMVTEMDTAIKTRMKHYTLVHDAKEWVVWATANDLDTRGISYISRYPEMMIGKELTNPRSLSEFFRFLKLIPDLSDEKSLRRAKVYAEGLLDEETVTSMMTFMQRDVELVVEPEAILEGEDWIPAHMEKLSKGVKNKRTGEMDTRIDILAVTVDRLYAYMVRPDFEPHNGSIKHFQEFATSPHLEEDLRHNLCLRLFRRRDDMQQWLLGSQALTKLVCDVV